MTRKEMTEIFSVMLLAWPNAEMFNGGVQKLGPTIELWTACLPDVDFWQGQQAVIKLCRECKFPPSIAEFREKAEKVQSEVSASIDMAWSHLRLDMQLGKTPEEAAQGWPEGSDVSRAIAAIGGPSRLVIVETHTLGDGTVKTYEKYNYSEFCAAYEKIIREKSALGSGQRKAVNPGMKQIGGKT